MYLFLQFLIQIWSQNHNCNNLNVFLTVLSHNNARFANFTLTDNLFLSECQKFSSMNVDSRNVKRRPCFTQNCDRSVYKRMVSGSFCSYSNFPPVKHQRIRNNSKYTFKILYIICIFFTIFCSWIHIKKLKNKRYAINLKNFLFLVAELLIENNKSIIDHANPNDNVIVNPTAS